MPFVGSYPATVEPMSPWYGEIPTWISNDAGESSFVAGKTIVIGTGV